MGIPTHYIESNVEKGMGFLAAMVDEMILMERVYVDLGFSNCPTKRLGQKIGMLVSGKGLPL